MSWPSWLPDDSVLFALAIIGATSGALGCFAVLRRQSLLGDTLAHAALPGVCLAYLLTETKTPLVLLMGALATGLLGTLLVLSLLRNSRLKQDAALGLVLSTFFGLGIVLLTFLQNRPDAGQSGLDHFIYGQAAYLIHEHVVTMLWFGSAVLLVLILLYKEFKLLSFDSEYATTLGFPRRWLEVILSLLIVIGVMISLRAVGVVLTVALLIAPAAAARQWTHRLSTMIFLAMAIGVLSALLGAIWSQNTEQTPTGPAVVLVASALLAVSLLFAPQRGLYWSWLRLRSHRGKVRRENLLTDFYRLGERRGDGQSWTVEELAAMRRQPQAEARKTLRELEAMGLVAPAPAPEKDAAGWHLTFVGQKEAARVVRNHRLWELYLARRLDLALDHVHRDAEDMEHALPPEVVAELEATFQHPERDPHGHVIPRTTTGE
jgi:manganese/zinc/iron transport system permease protein